MSGQSTATRPRRWRPPAPPPRGRQARAVRLPGVWSFVRSSQIVLVCPHSPLCETFTLAAIFQEVACDPLDVVAEFVAGDLVLAQLSTEPAVQAQAAAQVNLESLDGAAVSVVDHL